MNSALHQRLQRYKRIQLLRRQAYLREVAARMPSFDIPVADSAWTAPGWVSDGIFYSCIPDSAYPWDPAVLKAIRAISPDYVPMTVKTVWRWSNYHEQGKLGEPMILTHHVIGRTIRDASWPTHEFSCDMPALSWGGFRQPFQSLAASKPNYLEVTWQDRLNKQYSPDLPGAYLPFDWELYYALRRSFTNNQSPEEWNAANMRPYIEMMKRRKKHEQEERDYIERDRRQWEEKQFSRKVVGDSDWEEYFSGEEEPADTRKIQTTVPDLSGTRT